MWSKLKSMFYREEWSFDSEIARLEGQVGYLENKLQRQRSGRAMEVTIIDINSKRAQIADLKALKRLEVQQLKGGN